MNRWIVWGHTVDCDLPVSDLLNREASREGRSSSVPIGEPCDICGCSMLDLHCKLICRNCGFMRDCSDP